MARIARLVVPGIPHHVTQRGNRYYGDSLLFLAVIKRLERDFARHLSHAEQARSETSKQANNNGAG